MESFHALVPTFSILDIDLFDLPLRAFDSDFVIFLLLLELIDVEVELLHAWSC